MLEWGASAHVACECELEILGEDSFGSDCAIALGQVAMDALISSLRIAVKSCSCVPMDSVPHPSWCQICGPRFPNIRPQSDCAGPHKCFRSLIQLCGGLSLVGSFFPANLQPRGYGIVGVPAETQGFRRIRTHVTKAEVVQEK
jgi:hypothetical protein